MVDAPHGAAPAAVVARPGDVPSDCRSDCRYVFGDAGDSQSVTRCGDF